MLEYAIKWNEIPHLQNNLKVTDVPIFIGSTKYFSWF